MSSHKACLLRDSRSIESLKGYERCYLVECTDCGFVFVGRIPSAQELDEHYNRVYTENEQSYEWLSPVTTKRFYELLDFMEPYRKTGRLLDVGCGVGHFLKHALDRGWEAHGM